MAHAVLANEDKELTSVIIFPSVYAESLSKMKPGTHCKPILAETNSGAISLKGFIR
jgi:hypothetical protein